MAEKKITPSDLRNAAQALIKSGKMPSPEEFAKAMAEEQKDYVPKLKKSATKILKKKSSPSSAP